MPDELLKPLQVPPPKLGIIQGLEAFTPPYPPNASPDLLNIRCVNDETQTREGISSGMPTGIGAGTASLTGVGSGVVNWQGVLYKSTGDRFRIAARGGVLYGMKAGVDSAFSAITGGSGLNTRPTYGLYNAVQLRDRLYLSDRDGALKAIYDDSGLTCESVTQPAAPTAAPGYRRRTWRVLEAWDGGGSPPANWTDTADFDLTLATAASDPGFPGGGNVADIEVNTTNAKGDQITETTTAGQELGSQTLAFWFQQTSRRQLVAFTLGLNAAAEFSFEIDPPDKDVNYAFFMGAPGPVIKYKGFTALKNPNQVQHLFVSPIYLPGNVDGLIPVKYVHTHARVVNNQILSESEASPETPLVDVTAQGINYKSTAQDPFQKCVELTVDSDRGSDTTTNTIFFYRNGLTQSLTVDDRGQIVWVRVGRCGDINSALTNSPAAGATLFQVTTGQGAADLVAGDWIVLEEGVAGKQELVQVEAVTVGTPDSIRAAQYIDLVTDLVIGGVGNEDEVSSAGRPFNQGDVGKTIRITGGTGFTQGYYTVNSVDATTFVATLSGAAGTAGSTGGSAKVMTGCQFSHSAGATVTPGLVDNMSASTAAAVVERLEIERDGPPTGIHWLVKLPDGRLCAANWKDANGNRNALGLAWSNKPTVVRPYDHQVWPDNQDPLTTLSPIQGFRVTIDGDASGDEITWMGLFRGIITVMTRRAVYQVSAYSQADWSPTAVQKVVEGIGCIAGETVQEVGGRLIWVSDGPRIVSWDGRSAPDEGIAFQRVSSYLQNAPKGQWGYWYARSRAVAIDGAEYRLGIVPEQFASVTNLAIDAGVASRVSSASYTFTDADIGAVLEITAGTGFTAGRYVIGSITSGAANLDRNAGTVASTGGSAVLTSGVNLFLDCVVTDPGAPWYPRQHVTTNGVPLALTAPVEWAGPGDEFQDFLAALTSGAIYRTFTGDSDAGVAIPIRWLTPYFDLEWVCRGQKLYFYPTPTGADTLEWRIRMTGSEYRDVALYPATDGDPYYDWETVLADSDSAVAEYYERLPMQTLLGRRVQFQVTGDVSNRPEIDEVRFEFSQHRLRRLQE